MIFFILMCVEFVTLSKSCTLYLVIRDQISYMNFVVESEQFEAIQVIDTFRIQINLYSYSASW